MLGDAYEYLMRHLATESGKTKGQFYTPAEVSRVMAQVVGVGSAKDAGQTIHDPTCGSGSLLLKAHDEAKHRTGLDLALYGQEMDKATTTLARINMILHDCATASPACARRCSKRRAGPALGDRPKALVEELGEGLLKAFSDGSGGSDGSMGLLDAYGVYQHGDLERCGCPAGGAGPAHRQEA